MADIGEYTYEEYLHLWEGRFSNSDTGEYEYYRGNAHVPCTVRRLSEQEFRDHLAAMEEADAAFDAAYEAGDPDEMDRALKDGFPHELALLI